MYGIWKYIYRMYIDYKDRVKLKDKNVTRTLTTNLYILLFARMRSANIFPTEKMWYILNVCVCVVFNVQWTEFWYKISQGSSSEQEKCWRIVLDCALVAIMFMCMCVCVWVWSWLALMYNWIVPVVFSVFVTFKRFVWPPKCSESCDGHFVD